MDLVTQGACAGDLFPVRGAEEKGRGTDANVEVADDGDPPAAVDAAFVARILRDPVRECLKGVAVLQLRVAVGWCRSCNPRDVRIDVAAYFCRVPFR